MTGQKCAKHCKETGDCPEPIKNQHGKIITEYPESLSGYVFFIPANDELPFVTYNFRCSFSDTVWAQCYVWANLFSLHLFQLASRLDPRTTAPPCHSELFKRIHLPG
jgi:hypothetical protein